MLPHSVKKKKFLLVINNFFLMYKKKYKRNLVKYLGNITETQVRYKENIEKT